MNHLELLEEYRDGAHVLRSKLESLQEAVLSFVPPVPDAWSIREHAIHLADSEINGFLRLKSIIAQPGSACYVMDEDAWTKNIRRKREDLGKYLSAYALVKELVYDLLVDEDPANWNRDYFVRRYHGETVNVTIEKCLGIYINHLKFHLPYIDRNIALYEKEAAKVR